ncbi:BUD14 [Candida margitis]|uniref:BUD14 n=1 Tax=Candida margitis TaxID=1775924 RepID=UPI002227C330|nr:BUD14 [Candida margitis]KAI5969745.1 BUD14 [Candida margitis]
MSTITSEQRSREQDPHATTTTATAATTTSNTPKDNCINDDSADLAFDQTILDDTNKILKELERKLSISSSTSSQYTNASSVVHNNQFSGLGKQRIQSHVLNTMIHDSHHDYNENDKTQRIHNSIFNPNELFQERSQYSKFTKFTAHYNDDSVTNKGPQMTKQRDRKGSNTVIRQNSLNLTQNRLEKKYQSQNYANDRKQIDDILGDAQINDVYASDEGSAEEEEEEEDDDDDSRYDFYYTAGDDENDEDFDTFDDDLTHSDDDLNGEKHNQCYGHEEEEEDQSDLIIPPSPPRSPPRDLDPSKLYGLYDFSGPDPSHCSLTRDEPVHLLNDEDNYWWLIKKLTKDERIARYEETMEGDIIDIESDKEDGKIGFVPAECLETHGERLARLNCHRNEEMERFVENELQLTDRQPKVKKAVKSVTFDNLGDLIDSDDELMKDEMATEFKQQRYLGPTESTGTGTFAINRDEQDIRKILELYNVDLNELQQPSPMQEPETLSDVYPMESPLIINKRSN